MAGLLSCGGNPERQPPLYATLPAPDRDLEKPPANGRLPGDVTPLRYALSLALDPKQKSYRGEVTIELSLDRPRESIWLHNLGPRVSSALAQRPGSKAGSNRSRVRPTCPRAASPHCASHTR
jgi:hypothetical protein